MIGDAPGDLKATKADNALFYPVNPADEEASWRRFFEESFDKFIDGNYEEILVKEFDSYLPTTPPWIKQDTHMIPPE